MSSSPPRDNVAISGKVATLARSLLEAQLQIVALVVGDSLVTTNRIGTAILSGQQDPLPDMPGNALGQPRPRIQIVILEDTKQMRTFALASRRSGTVIGSHEETPIDFIWQAYCRNRDSSRQTDHCPSKDLDTLARSVSFVREVPLAPVPLASFQRTPELNMVRTTTVTASPFVDNLHASELAERDGPYTHRSSVSDQTVGSSSFQKV